MENKLELHKPGTAKELKLSRELVTLLNNEVQFSGAIVSKAIYLKLVEINNFHKEILEYE